jgi:hypothetical protein
MTMSVRDLVALVGKPLKNGATLKRSAVFSVPLLANASAGVTFTAVVYGTPVDRSPLAC